MWDGEACFLAGRAAAKLSDFSELGCLDEHLPASLDLLVLESAGSWTGGQKVRLNCGLAAAARAATALVPMCACAWDWHPFGHHGGAGGQLLGAWRSECQVQAQKHMSPPLIRAVYAQVEQLVWRVLQHYAVRQEHRPAIVIISTAFVVEPGVMPVRAERPHCFQRPVLKICRCPRVPRRLAVAPVPRCRKIHSRGHA